MAKTASAEDYARARDTLDFLIGIVEAEAVARRLPEARGTAIPVSVIAGFLGAGKTTLMRRLLTASHGLKIAALVNDFAALNIDADLVAGVSRDTVALTNGCICCSQSGGAARALLEITAREERPDFVIVETSGISDPWALAQMVGTVPGTVLDSVLTVVDAAADISDPAVRFLMQRQVSAADIVLLNKTDLVTRPAIDAIADRIADLAPRAQLLRTVNCAIPHVLVFDRAVGRVDAIDDGQAIDTDTAFASWMLAASGPTDRAVIEECLMTLPRGVLRIKGVIDLNDNPDGPELLQAVGRRWSWERAQGPALGCLVVIGLADAVDADRIDRHFAASKLHTM